MLSIEIATIIMISSSKAIIFKFISAIVGSLRLLYVIALHIDNDIQYGTYITCYTSQLYHSMAASLNSLIKQRLFR